MFTSLEPRARKITELHVKKRMQLIGICERKQHTLFVYTLQTLYRITYLHFSNTQVQRHVWELHQPMSPNLK